MTIRRAFRSMPRNPAELDRLFRDVTVADRDIDDAQLRDSAALSVIGRASNSAGTPADIVSASNDTFLVRRANALTWGSLSASDIPTGFISADMITQHTAAIRAFLPPAQAQRQMDDSQAILAAQVFS